MNASTINDGLSAEQAKPENKSGPNKVSSLMAKLLGLCFPRRRARDQAKAEASAKANVKLKTKRTSRAEDPPPDDPDNPPPPPPAP